MAESSGSQLTVDWFGFGLRTDVHNMSDWSNGQDSHRLKSNYSIGLDHQKRSEMVHAIIHNRSLKHLGSILGSGWDVNKPLRMPNHDYYFDKFQKRYTQRTALEEVALRGWTEGLRMLLDAGAQCKISGASSNILIQALENPDCPPDLIDILLRFGADPNDHVNWYRNIPLLYAIDRKQNLKHVELLLEHGADPNVIGNESTGKVCPLSAAQEKGYESFIDCFRTLVDFGADVNYYISGRMPLIHEMIAAPKIWFRDQQFHKEQLELFFLHGGNISVEDRDHRTALEYVVRSEGHSNSMKWLIRHGGDISPMRVTLLDEDFHPTRTNFSCFSETPLILLQAGMWVSDGVQTQLRDIEMYISAWLQDNAQMKGREYFDRRIDTMWDQLVEVEERELQRIQGNGRKATFPEYWTHQMDDLQEFSDASLQIYPEGDLGPLYQWEYALHQLHRVLDFLSRPQSLEWHCRRCVRENLVSLQPSVVKTLPVPPRLKRYILCHEI